MVTSKCATHVCSADRVWHASVQTTDTFLAPRLCQQSLHMNAVKSDKLQNAMDDSCTHHRDLPIEPIVMAIQQQAQGHGASNLTNTGVQKS
jgi:hypothetical protein